MSQYKKGFGGIIALMVVAALIVAVIALMMSSEVTRHILEIRKNLEINIELDDSGTEVIAFLQVQKDGISYMSILGTLEDNEKMQNAVETLNKMADDGYYLSIRDDGSRTVKEYKKGTPPKDILTLDIPLPNGKKGSMDMITW